MSNNSKADWAEREIARYYNLCRIIQEMNEEIPKSQEELLKELELYEQESNED